MGKRLSAHPLINYHRQSGIIDLPPVPFPMIPGDYRPLAGIKVVELARVIAAPALGQALAAFGAEVVKVESPDLPDPNVSCFLRFEIFVLIARVASTVDPDSGQVYLPP